MKKKLQFGVPSLLYAKLTFILKSDFIGMEAEEEGEGGWAWATWGHGGLSQRAFAKDGNHINLIEDLLRMLKASTLWVRACFTHQRFPPLCF